MDYKLINEALASIENLRYGNTKFKKVTEKTTDEETTEIYSLGEDDLHIKLVFISDSYGDNEHLVSVKIVKPVVKTVTDFE